MGKKTIKKAENYDIEASRLPGDRWVSMGNALVRAGHGLTLTEKRLIACAVSKLDSRKVLTPSTLLTTRITAAEYAETFEVDTTTAYEQLQEAAKHLFSRSITFYEPANKRNGKPIEPTRVQMRWVGQVHYQVGEGWVELHWWHGLLQHITGLRKNFTSYQLKQASALRSMYSWRLLELISRFESSGWFEITIEDFAQSMDATEKQRADFAKIRTKIIEPAVKELIERDGWTIQWEVTKKGRKTVGLRFTFERNDHQMQLALG